MTSLQAQKAVLLPLLQQAIELELSTVPPYLTALMSIKKPGNRVAANLIRSVAIEEMLHMVLVGNLISSLGGTVKLCGDAVPVYPLRLEFDGSPFDERAFMLHLEAFSPQAMETFKKIEMPASLLPHPTMLAATVVIPGITLGAFYDRIMALVQKLCDDYPDSAVFCGDPALQIDEQYYWSSGGKPIVVTSLATALEALNVIKKQGEASGESIMDGDAGYFGQPEEAAHYFRFNEIACQRRYQSDDDPRESPTGEPFPVDYEAVFPIRRDAKSEHYRPGSELARLNEVFNRQYSMMLYQLELAFNGNPAVMYDAILNGMHGMTSVAHEMMSLPIEDDPRGEHGAPSFEWVAPPV
jgi:hypothetical protein